MTKLDFSILRDSLLAKSREMTLVSSLLISTLSSRGFLCLQINETHKKQSSKEENWS